MIDGWVLVLVLSFMSSVWGLAALLIEICRGEPVERSTDMHCAPVADRGSTPMARHQLQCIGDPTISVRDRSCADSPRFTASNRTRSVPRVGEVMTMPPSWPDLRGL